MKLAIQSWERNGYNDSDGYMIYLDTDTMKVRQELFWTTRGVMESPSYNKDPKEWTPVRVAAVKHWLACRFINRYRKAETWEINKPDDVAKGQIVMLLEDHKNAKKVKREQPCWKCDGSGNWVNPRNAADVRKCFNCNGTGIKAKYTRTKGWIHWPKGTQFKVHNCEAFGTFYRNGYNRPSRFNRQVTGWTADGEFIRAPLAKLGLIERPLTEAEMVKKAWTAANGLNFVAAFHGTWVDSDGDYIGKALKLQEIDKW